MHVPGYDCSYISHARIPQLFQTMSTTLDLLGYYQDFAGNHAAELRMDHIILLQESGSEN